MLSKSLQRMHFTSQQSFSKTRKDDATSIDTPPHSTHILKEFFSHLVIFCLFETFIFINRFQHTKKSFSTTRKDDATSIDTPPLYAYLQRISFLTFWKRQIRNSHHHQYILAYKTNPFQWQGKTILLPWITPPSTHISRELPLLSTDESKESEYIGNFHLDWYLSSYKTNPFHFQRKMMLLP